MPNAEACVLIRMSNDGSKSAFLNLCRWKSSRITGVYGAVPSFEDMTFAAKLLIIMSVVGIGRN